MPIPAAMFPTPPAAIQLAIESDVPGVGFGRRPICHMMAGLDWHSRPCASCPASSGDVPDDQELRFIALRPSDTHKNNDQQSAALKAANDILANRGSGPR
jgi:hypothetical protein